MVIVETGEAHVSVPQFNFVDGVLVLRVKFEQVWNLILLQLRRKFLHEILKKDTNHIQKDSELSQISKMKIFEKIVNVIQPINIFAKRYILDI